MFNKPNDLNYRRFLRRLHEKVLFDWYMEIGSRTGESLREVRSKTICVDPFFRIESNVINQKPAFLAFQQTSDSFFEDGHLKKLGIELGFSFLDGMHLVEYLLRDFIQAEANSSPQAVIALHDCCPYDYAMTTRDVANAPKKAWTGDVWKLIPILRQYRPDLELTILGCKPTGLVLVSKLDPKNTCLADRYEEIVAQWLDVTLESYGSDQFYSGFKYTPVSEIEEHGYDIFCGAMAEPSVVLQPNFVSP